MSELLGANFSIDISDLRTGLLQANRLIRESESEFKAAAAGMDDWRESQEGLEARIKHLNNATDLQRKKIKSLEDSYKENLAKGIDPMSAGMVKLRTDINKEQATLAKNEKELRDQEEALKELGKASEDAGENLKDVGDKAKDAGDGFTVAKGAIANFIADGLSSLVSGAKDAISTVAGLAEATREYREDIGKLETAFETAGLSSQLATKTYKDLYTTLGEEDRTVEAVNHLAKFVKTEEDMAKWTNILTGVWGTFGDSLPIEGLTEAANESSRNGKTVGVLADAINWAAEAGETFGVKLKENTKANEEWNKAVEKATTAEEYFNLALQECSTEQERQALISETLNGLYGEAATNYKANNKSIIEARKASSDYTDTVAELGETVEPVTTKAKEGFNMLLKEAVKLTKDVDFDKLGRKMDKAFDTVAEDILPAIVEGFERIGDNWKTIQAGLIGAFSAFTTAKLVMGIASATTAFKTLFATIKAFTMTNPIGLIATGVGLLVGGIVALSAATEEYTEAQQEEIDAAKESAEIQRERAEAYREVKEAAQLQAESELAELNNVQRLNEELKLLVDEKGKVKEKDEDRVAFILNELNLALGTEYTLTDNLVQNYKTLQQEIDTLIAKERAQILLTAEKAGYEEAVINLETAKQEVTRASIELAEAEAEATRINNELSQARIELADAEARGDYFAMEVAAEKIAALAKESEAQTLSLEERKKAYEDAKGVVSGYYGDIERYETGQSLVLQGKTQEAIDYLSKSSSAFSNSTKDFAHANEEQASELYQNAENAKAWADELDKMFKEGVEGVTKEMVEEAKTAAAEAEEQWNTVGKAIIEATGQGIKDSYSLLEQEAVGAANDAAAAARRHLSNQLSGMSSGIRMPTVAPRQMATGGVVRSATNAIIGEAGPEAVLPLQRNTGWMDTLADKIASKTQPTKGGGVVVNQTNNYSESHSRYELYQAKQDTIQAVKIALREA